MSSQRFEERLLILLKLFLRLKDTLLHDGVHRGIRHREQLSDQLRHLGQLLHVGRVKHQIEQHSVGYTEQEHCMIIIGL